MVSSMYVSEQKVELKKIGIAEGGAATQSCLCRGVHFFLAQSINSHYWSDRRRSDSGFPQKVATFMYAVFHKY